LIWIGCFMAFTVKAQFFQGFGLTAGITYCNQKLKIDSLNEKLKYKYRFGGNAGIFVEYIEHPYIHMVTELQLNQKGGKDRVTGTKYRVNYFSFNNFVKFRQELYDVTPYFLIGPRVEYHFNSSPGLPYRPFHITGSMGPGMEFLYWKPWVPFVEFQWNPDLMKAYRDPYYTRRHNAFELRVGIKYVPRKAANCPKVYTK
jgi:hypothetical protein